MILLIVLLLAIAVFGVGTIVKGVFWLTVLAVAAFVAIGFFGWRALSNRT